MLDEDEADEESSDEVDADRESRIRKKRRRRRERMGSSREISDNTGARKKPISVTATDKEQGLQEILVNMKWQMEELKLEWRKENRDKARWMHQVKIKTIGMKRSTRSKKGHRRIPRWS